MRQAKPSLRTTLRLNLMVIGGLLAALMGTIATASSLGPKAAAIKISVSHHCGAVKACFSRLQDALDAASKVSVDQPILIDMDRGDYYEKVTIARPNLWLKGKGKNQTRLYFDAVAQTSGKYHRNQWGTPGSATLTINAKDVRVSSMSIENRFDYLANDALPDGHAAKISNSQGVAVLLDIDSDRVSFDKTALIGYQDTLFANGKRAYFNRSEISGNVDFIFGNGQVLIENSLIKTRRRSAVLKPNEYHSFIAAPSTQLSQKLGIIFYRSKLVREAGVPDASVALGRPWHPTTTFADGRYADPNAVGQSSFIDCFMDKHIHPDHWTFMNGTARDGTKTAVFRPQDARFTQTGSKGPGAKANDIGMKLYDIGSIDEIKALFFKDWQRP